MEFERIQRRDHPDFQRAFRLYETSFPLHEQRPRSRQEEVLGHPQYRFEVIREGETFVGILLFWEGPGFLYVEHFAVSPELRGTGYGSRSLEKLKELGKPIVLEIDPPVDGTARRRKGFYEKLGFHANPWPHVHPPYRREFQGHELVVMTWPEEWPQEDYARFSDYLGETVMADSPA